MEEIWKDVDEFEKYQVSNLGEVRCLKFGKEKILKPSINKYGYKQVIILKNKKRMTLTIHRLVASAYLGISKLHVNHINGIETDNRLENLEYVSPRENSSHSKFNSNRTSKLMGVSWRKDNQKWVAKLGINGKVKHLGCFDNELDAYNAYLKALKENGITNKYA